MPALPYKPEEPVQVIHDVDLPMPVRDIQDLAADQQHDAVQRVTREYAETPFDFSQAPLLRIVLFKLSPTEHVLIFSGHHIISDGWSVGILVEELGTLYNAYAQGETNPLPPLPIQYADFAAWQAERLSGAYLDKLIGYWRQQLAGIPALLELPTDYPRRAVQRYHGAAEPFFLPAQQTQQLNQLSQQSGVTLFMTLLAAYAVLLFRYTGQSDIVIGSPVANRTHSQIEPLIGFFINNLVLRVKFTENLTFSELLQQVKTTALDAYSHQELSFERLVDELQVERSLSYSPIFQTLFVIQNAPVGEIELGKLRIKPLPTENVNAIYDLILWAEEHDTDIECKFRYKTDLFEKNHD